MARQFSLVAQIPPVAMLPAAADAAGRQSAYRSLKNALKAYVVVHLNQGAANTVTLTLQQSTSVTGTPTKAVGAVPIWSNLDTSASDTIIARAPAASYVTDAGIKDKIVVFEITPESCMDVTNNYDCIAVTTGASAAGNITEATLHVLMSYQSAVPPISTYTD